MSELFNLKNVVNYGSDISDVAVFFCAICAVASPFIPGSYVMVVGSFFVFLTSGIISRAALIAALKANCVNASDIEMKETRYERGERLDKERRK
jgi:hypothetical protein